MKQHGQYLAFFHDSDILSHWHRCEFTYMSLTFNHVEKFMMYAKANMFKDIETRDRILKTDTPMACKKLGRQVKGFDPAVWDKYKYRIILVGNREKYKQNPGLGRFLLDTDPNILVEGNPYDRIYGVGLHKDDPAIGDPANWRGENLCGRAIMEVREELKEGQQTHPGVFTHLLKKV
ncbi:Swarming motility protein YbiA [Caballeronia arationis]|uniref:NADAR family protein n=1 Tax=Caballeronia arationis TaxID=1777142 RepID=UPI00074B898E|nr:NADAR family protein [Caballeronia arationis]SAK83422.1 Swarming motility protein YbiA [Caballeronia arationis]